MNINFFINYCIENLKNSSRYMNVNSPGYKYVIDAFINYQQSQISENIFGLKILAKRIIIFDIIFTKVS